MKIFTLILILVFLSCYAGFGNEKVNPKKNIRELGINPDKIKFVGCNSKSPNEKFLTFIDKKKKKLFFLDENFNIMWEKKLKDFIDRRYDYTAYDNGFCIEEDAYITRDYHLTRLTLINKKGQIYRVVDDKVMNLDSFNSAIVPKWFFKKDIFFIRGLTPEGVGVISIDSKGKIIFKKIIKDNWIENMVVSKNLQKIAVVAHKYKNIYNPNLYIFDIKGNLLNKKKLIGMTRRGVFFSPNTDKILTRGYMPKDDSRTLNMIFITIREFWVKEFKTEKFLRVKFLTNKLVVVLLKNKVNNKLAISYIRAKDGKEIKRIPVTDFYNKEEHYISIKYLNKQEFIYATITEDNNQMFYLLNLEGKLIGKKKVHMSYKLSKAEKRRKREREAGHSLKFRAARIKDNTIILPPYSGYKCRVIKRNDLIKCK